MKYKTDFYEFEQLWVLKLPREIHIQIMVGEGEKVCEQEIHTQKM